MVAICSFLFSCCFAALAYCHTPNLSVTQLSGQTIDCEVSIQVEQLAPFQEIQLQAETEDQSGEMWSSHASFLADSQGFVDVASSQPIGDSSYKNIDRMGLFWSMLPSSGKSFSSFKCKNDCFFVTLKLVIDGKVVAQESMTRYLKTPDVKRIDVRENGLVGALFLPQSEAPLPVIITLSGSNGGFNENRAKLLASNGFAVLALGYFRVEGLPWNLQEIPLEYFETAFAWLKQQPNIDASQVGLYGVSRGGELSLLLGSFFPDSLQAIAAIVPSSVVYPGLNRTPVHAWVYDGKAVLPFAPVSEPDLSGGKGFSHSNPANVCQSFLEGMKEKEAFEAASIHVEKIRCPILLVSGGDDQVWPSKLYVNRIIQRLTDAFSPISCRHLHYPNAGHGISVPNLPISSPTYFHPVGKLWFSMGGSRSSDANASLDTWTSLLSFFRETLQANVNNAKFSSLRKYDLPVKQYAITGSGRLGMLNLRTIGNIDIIVASELWDTLAAEYEVIDMKGVEKIVFPCGVVEAFKEGSFYMEPKDHSLPVAERIAKAELIDGLPFDSIENILYYKCKLAREKDVKDIQLIERWLKSQKN